MVGHWFTKEKEREKMTTNKGGRPKKFSDNAKKMSISFEERHLRKINRLAKSMKCTKADAVRIIIDSFLHRA